jgi:hypothetical protein
MAKSIFEQCIDEFVKNKVIMGLVKRLHPRDLLDIFAKKLEVHPIVAAKIVDGLLEWSGSGIESNKGYPVQHGNETKDSISVEDNPYQEYWEDIKGYEKKESKKIDEDYQNTRPDHTFNNWEFPPNPLELGKRDNDWPYDPMTKQIMDPKDSGKSRRGMPLMNGYDPAEEKPGDRIAKGQPGVSGLGTFQKMEPHSDGDMSSFGSSVNTQGVQGLSRSPAGKEYDMPGPGTDPKAPDERFPMTKVGENKEIDDSDSPATKPFQDHEGGLLKGLLTYFGGSSIQTKLGSRGR